MKSRCTLVHSVLAVAGARDAILEAPVEVMDVVTAAHSHAIANIYIYIHRYIYIYIYIYICFYKFGV